jgi:hypothetical protein
MQKYIKNTLGKQKGYKREIVTHRLLTIIIRVFNTPFSTLAISTM